MKIVSKRERIEYTSYQRVFDYADEPGSGFGFPCTAEGVIESDMCDAAKENLAHCLTGIAWNGRKLIDRGIATHRATYIKEAVGVCCECGREVYLSGFTCSCECGADYNSSGQRLAPRPQWGEETGESAADLIGL